MKCERCGGLGLSNYKHIACGMCFACGATPAGEVVSVAVRATLRERRILDIATILRRAETEKREGTLKEWWADVVACEDTALRARVETAPADVRDRARAAFARLGLAI